MPFPRPEHQELVARLHRLVDEYDRTLSRRDELNERIDGVLVELYEGGANLAAVARGVGVTRQAIDKRIHRRRRRLTTTPDNRS